MVAGRATSYTDYYKNNEVTPETETPQYGPSSIMGAKKTTEELDAEEKKKAAIRRRLRMRKVGK